MNTFGRYIRNFVIVAVLLFGCAGILSAQITASATSLTFYAQAGGLPTASQPVTITSTGASPVTVTPTFKFPDWIVISPPLNTPVTTPATFQIYVDPSSIPAGTTQQSGTILFNGGGTAVTVSVTVILSGGGGTGSSAIYATPASLSFTSQTPTSQTLTVTSLTGTNQFFTVSASTTNGINWLTANVTNFITPGTVVVSVNPTGLSAGNTYAGTVTLTPSGGGGSVQVPVTYTLTGTPQLTVSPSSVSFYYQLGTVTYPTAQQLSLTSSGTAVSFSLNYGTTSGGNWLVASPISGATPANVAVQVTPSAIPQSAGTYTGSITIYASGGTTTVQVSLLVSGSPLVTATPASLSFTMATTATLPAAQTLTLGSTGTGQNFSLTSSTNWLSVTPLAGITPTSVSVSVNSAALTLLPGTYNATISVIAPTAGNSPLSVPVTLTVGNTAVVTAFPTALTFNYQIGQSSPNPQSLTVSSSGVPQTFTATALVSTPAGGNWLFVFPSTGTTSSSPNVTVSLSASGLSVGQYSGSIMITPSGTGASPVTIPVTLNVSNSALLNVSPSALSFTFTGGSTAPQQLNLSLTSTDPTSQLTFTVYATQNPGGSPLQIGYLGQTTPTTVSVTVSPLGLAAGVYSGSIRVQASGANAYDIPVSVNVSSGATLSVTPSSLSFTQPSGGLAPPAQALSVSSTISSVGFTVATASSGLNWLSVTPQSGSTPGNLSVSVNGSTLSPGTYSGTVTITAPGATGSPLNVPVTLTITSQATMSVTPSALAYSYQIAGTAPPTQNITVSSSGIALTVSATAATSTGTNWLSVNQSSGTTPATFTISVNPTSLTAGTYTGTITLTAQGASNSPQTVGVTLTVTAPPAGNLTKIVNAANYIPGALSPGEIITLGGVNIGSTTPASLSLTSSNMLATTIGDTQVLFDGLAAPMIYTSSSQVSAIVPYEVAGRLSTSVQVSYKSVLSNALVMQVTSSAPGIFTTNQAGSGQGAILNQNSSVNGAGNPAARGSIVQVFGTGEGVVTPAVITGSITSGLHTTLQQARATVGGRDAVVAFAGAAPGLVAGVFQVNVVIPDDASSGSNQIVITFGGNTVQSGVTVAVQ